MHIYSKLFFTKHNEKYKKKGGVFINVNFLSVKLCPPLFGAPLAMSVYQSYVSDELNLNWVYVLQVLACAGPFTIFISHKTVQIYSNCHKRPTTAREVYRYIQHYI